MCKEKDQTLSIHKNISGRGSLLVLDHVPAGKGRPRVLLVENIAYADALERGKHSVAVKWIPHSIMSSQEIRNADCSMACPGQETCPSPCLCYSEQCYSAS